MYNKKELLTEIFDIENIAEILNSNSIPISKDQLISILSNTTYSLKESTGLSSASISKYLRILWPDRPKTPNKVDIWLLYKYGYKECKKCSKVYDITFFHKSKSRSDGLNAACKNCQLDSTSMTSANRQAKYKAALLQRIPSWINSEELERISKFYANCPTGHHVDHIIPLQGNNVSGFHALNNLQYLTAEDNVTKRNTFEPL